MRYPAVFTDFDGTLLRSDLTVSAYTLDVIKRYEEAGGTLVVTTGRMYSSIYNSAMRVGLKKGLVISYNGARLTDMTDGKVLYSNELDTLTAVTVARALEKEDIIALHAYIDDILHVKEVNEGTSNYERVCEIKAKITGINISDYIEQGNKKVAKLLAITKSKNRNAEYMYYSGIFGERCDFCSSQSNYFECTAKGVNKGSGVNGYCKLKGITAKDIITFGDANNDVPMFKFSDLSFCVENGSDDAKKAAKMVCPSNDEDGVAKMIEKYCL